MDQQPPYTAEKMLNTQVIAASSEKTMGAALFKGLRRPQE